MNQPSKTLDKPDYMIKTESFITPSGTELVLGYIVVDINNQQIAPNKNEVFLTFTYARESLTKLMDLARERRELQNKLYSPEVNQ